MIDVGSPRGKAAGAGQIRVVVVIATVYATVGLADHSPAIRATFEQTLRARVELTHYGRIVVLEPRRNEQPDKFFFGHRPADGSRTRDLLVGSQTLYQLSYCWMTRRTHPLHHALRVHAPFY
jgi:hypothetical protein